MTETADNIARPKATLWSSATVRVFSGASPRRLYVPSSGKDLLWSGKHSDLELMRFAMARRLKSRRVRSQAGKERRRGEDGEAPRAEIEKSAEEEVRRLVLAGQALSEAPPGQLDPEKAMCLKLKLDQLVGVVQGDQAKTDSEYFDWLEMNIPELSKVKGRPHWSESKKVMRKDETLLKDFEQTLNHNVAANAGKKHGASAKTYSDLADKSSDVDPYTAKQRVMRARRRQKAMQEAIKDILGIAALGETDGDKAIPPKEYKRRRKKLLEALRRVQRTK
jgi:hypothetical protein